MARNYSSVVEPKTLTSNITDATATQITLNNVTGLPSAPYVLVINPDTAKEEVVLVTVDQTGVTSPTLKVERAIEVRDGIGVARNDHTVGSIVKHMIVGSDLQIVHDHFSDNSLTAGTAHGVTGGVVGRTSSQTLTNKAIALGSNTVTGTKAQFNAAITDTDFATIDGTETLTAKTLTAPIITSPTISGTITGAVVTSANIVDGTIVNADINASAAIDNTKISGTAVTLAGTQALTNKTLTSPVITGGTINGGVALTVDSTELNKLDGVTTTTAQLNYLNTASSNIQTQLTSLNTSVTGLTAEVNNRQLIITGAATTIDTEDLTVSRALISNASGKVAVSPVTTGELALLNGLDNTGWDTDPGTAGGSWNGTGYYGRAKKFLGIVTFHLYAVRDGSTVSNSDVAGNMTDTLIYTLDAAYRPTYGFIVNFDIEGKTGGSAIINSDGTVYIRSMYDEDSSILNTDSVRLGATYVV